MIKLNQVIYSILLRASGTQAWVVDFQKATVLHGDAPS